MVRGNACCVGWADRWDGESEVVGLKNSRLWSHLCLKKGGGGVFWGVLWGRASGVTPCVSGFAVKKMVKESGRVSA